MTHTYRNEKIIVDSKLYEKDLYNVSNQQISVVFLNWWYAWNRYDVGRIYKWISKWAFSDTWGLYGNDGGCSYGRK